MAHWRGQNAGWWSGLEREAYVPVGFFFFQAEDGIRDVAVTGVQTCALPIYLRTGEPRVPIKDRRGDLLESAIPKVTIVKDGNYTTDDDDDDPSREVDLLAQIERNLTAHPLVGFVVEGLSPYGRLTSAVRTRLMRRAAFSGMPVVLTGRGNAEGFVPPPAAPFIGGGDLTAAEAPLLPLARPGQDVNASPAARHHR